MSAMTRIAEIEARHKPDRTGGAGHGAPRCTHCCILWPCDAAILLTQLREAEEKLGAVEVLVEVVEDLSPADVRRALDRILKGGE